MPAPNIEIEHFLPPNLEEHVAYFENITLGLDQPEIVYKGAVREVSDELPYFLLQSLNASKSANRNQPISTEGMISREALTDALVKNAFLHAIGDRQSEIYRRMIMMITGFAQANGDESATNHGFELGKRIITERAHRAALGLCLGSLMLVEPALESDQGLTLKERADRVYKSTRLQPPVKIPPAEGNRFDALLARMKTEDFVDVVTRQPEGRGLIKKMSYRIKLSRENLKWIRQARDPAKVGEVIEEVYDNHLFAPEMIISDEEADFITISTVKMCTYLGRAATKDETIAHDPRTAHINYLRFKLNDNSVAGALALFQKGVHNVARKELALKD